MSLAYSFNKDKQNFKIDTRNLSEVRILKLKELEKKLGYTFKDIGLLDQALIHSSYVGEKELDRNFCNERLEFLGDSILNYIMSEVFFLIDDIADEGRLSRRRSLAIKEEPLSIVAESIGLFPIIEKSRGVEQNISKKGRITILADAVEALIASIYIDGGIGDVKRFLENWFLDIIIEAINKEEIRDYKSLLQEEAHLKGYVDVSYKVSEERGPAHNKEFMVEVYIDNKKVSEGWGGSKKIASQRAAFEALKTFNNGEK